MGLSPSRIQSGPLRPGILAVLLLAAIPVTAFGVEGPAKLDWSAWQRMPVFHDGRMMPLDTFARAAVETICGEPRPKLGPEGISAEETVGSSAATDAGKLFADGKPRRFTAAELLFSWIVEPQRWEHVPFLAAGHELLRRDLLNLPLEDEEGRRLKYVSPRQVGSAVRLRNRLKALREEQSKAAQEGGKHELSELEKRANQLYESYSLYRLLTFNPVTPAGTRSRFLGKLGQTAQTWQRAMGLWRPLGPSLARLGRFHGETGPGTPLLAIREPMKRLGALAQDGDLPLEDVEPPVIAIRRSAADAARACAGCKAWLLVTPAPTDWKPSQYDALRAGVRELTAAGAELARQADTAHRALYDNGYSLRLAPGLNPAALESRRDPADDAQPWINLQTLLRGSGEVLAGVPPNEVARVRESFAGAATAYLDRDNPGRPERFAAAMDRFAAAVRALGEAVEPIRNNLPLEERDEKLIALTAYPPPGATWAEFHYNQLNPFRWSWTVGLVAVVCLGLAVGGLRKPMFWLGVLVLVAAQLLTLYGLGLRVYITGRAPVTNMFETVIFVALVVGLLGLWFTLLPLFWAGLRDAWRMTAVPLRDLSGTMWGLGTIWGLSRFSRSENGTVPLPNAPEPTLPAARQSWTIASSLLVVPRFALTVLTFLALAWFRYGPEQTHPYISLLPRMPVGSAAPTGNDLLVWAVGMCLLGMAVLYIPRLLLALVLSVLTVPYGLARHGVAKPLEEAVARKWFAVAGASVGFLAAYVAYYAPVFDKDINPLMPVLRNNFWLTSHVLAIVASYGAGALAWGLGLIALGYYLFGRYRDPIAQNSGQGRGTRGEGRATREQGRGPTAEGREFANSPLTSHPLPITKRLARRPPEACNTLGAFIYKATQVAVLLLIAGTILGGLWADVSWGRFWSWDRKEVWALISALVYLVVLHGRYAGWAGNFGLAAGSVVGATSILMAWYGVNYVFPGGRHAYGAGAGGLAPVVAIVALNWIFMGLAALRYLLETSGKKGTGPICAQLPAGRPGKLDLSPFSHPPTENQADG